MRKPVILLSAALLTASVGHAGIVGWITSKDRDWSYIQQTGGIRIGNPTEREGKTVLPIDYDATGVQGITTRPTVMDAGLAVRKIVAEHSTRNRLVLRVTTQVVEETSDTGRRHYADIDSLPAGSYEVYYETPGDEEKFLGKITVQ